MFAGFGAFIEKHIDKLMLSGLFLIVLGTFMHFARAVEFYATPDNATHMQNVVNWLENITGQILAALLTLMVGRGMTSNQPPPNGPPPGPPK
jgi:hypothetical protein